MSSTTGSGNLLIANNTSQVSNTTSQRLHHASSIASSSVTAPPLVLSLSQIQGGGGLLILNSSSASSGGTNNSSGNGSAGVVTFCSGKENGAGKAVVLKQETMDTSSCRLQDASNNNSNKMDIANGNVPFENTSVTYLRAKNCLTNSSTSMKHMETNVEENLLNIKSGYCSSDTVLVIGSGSSLKASEPVSLIGTGFFNETLDLSQEDIQRTLQANMPPSCTGDSVRHMASEPLPPPMSPDGDVVVSEINPMDFIDGCDDVVVSPVEHSQTTAADDDVFVNLDAFDMLGDFPELEILEPVATGMLFFNQVKSQYMCSNL